MCGDCFSAEATREHNDANVLALGARVTGAGLAIKIVETFLNTPFSKDERHVIIIHLSSFRSIPLPKQSVLLSIFRTD